MAIEFHDLATPDQDLSSPKVRPGVSVGAAEGKGFLNRTCSAILLTQVEPSRSQSPQLRGNASQSFSHDREIAHPGYDSVEFEDGTKTELTVRERAGRVRFYFPPGANRALIFKAGGSATADAKNREDDTSTVAICGDDTLGAPRRSS